MYLKASAQGYAPGSPSRQTRPVKRIGQPSRFFDALLDELTGQGCRGRPALHGRGEIGARQVPLTAGAHRNSDGSPKLFNCRSLPLCLGWQQACLEREPMFNLRGGGEPKDDSPGTTATGTGGSRPGPGPAAPEWGRRAPAPRASRAWRRGLARIDSFGERAVTWPRCAPLSS